MHIRLLGPVEASSNGDTIALGGPKQRALLAMLALRAGTVVSAEQLIDGLWGDEPPSTAGKLVQLYVSHVRKAMAAVGQNDVIATHGRGYELRVAREQVDVGRFERLLAQGAAREALALWRGQPLADLSGEPFADAEARRLEELHTAAAELAIEQDLDAGRHRVALPEIEGLLAREPLRERLHAQRMLALYRAGRQAEALDAYREARSTLVEEIGIEPGPELRRLQEQILRQDPGLLARERLDEAAARAASGRAGWRQAQDDVSAAVVELQALREQAAIAAAPIEAGACPFKGLASFDVGDADVFFGRERLVADLVARVPGSRLMGVVGPSGSGKSSALRAGLLASLTAGVLPGSDGWPFAVMRPGPHPARALERALAELPAEGLCVLAVDQFEEAFTLCADEAERAALIDGLLRCARDPGRTALVLLAIRADFYGHCAAYPELSRALDANQVLVGPMHADELRRAIELPARRAGVAPEPGLVDALVADVEGEPGGLPLLSTALRELWEVDGLTLAGYERSGGVQGAVARLAESAYEGLDDEGRRQARRSLLRLAGDGDTRTRVPIGELEPVVEALAAARLVTLGEGEAEIAHEALLREWPRLRAWLEEDAEGRRLHRHLTHGARAWQESDRDPAELYRASRLAAAMEWADPDELNAVERDFLAASRQAAEREAERERRAIRRLRGLLAGVGVLLVAAVAAGAVALSQRGEARDAAVAADAQRLGAEAITNDRLDQAMLLARAGVDLDDSAPTRSSLLNVLQRHPAALGELRGDGWPLNAVAASADGALFATGDERGGVTLYDARTRRRVAFHRESKDVINNLAFSPDGTTLASSSFTESGTSVLVLVEARTGTTKRRIELPPFPEEVFYVVQQVSFDPDGRHLVVQQSSVEYRDGPASVLVRIDARAGRIVRTRRVGDSGSRSLVRTGDGRRLFMTSPGDDRTYEVDPETLAVRRTWPAGGDSGAVSADGRRFALGEAQSGTVRLLDLRSGRVRTFEDRHDPHDDIHLVFALDGTLVTANQNEAFVWDLERDTVRERLAAHSEPINRLAVSPDSRTLYTAGTDAKVVLWDLAGDRRLDRRFAAGPPMTFDDGSPKGVAISPDGRTLAVTQMGGRLDLIDAQTLMLRRSARVLDGAALAVAYAADGKRLAVTGDGGRARLLDAGTLQQVTEFRHPPGGFAQGLALSPDGSRLAVAWLVPGEAFTGTVQLYDVRTGIAVGKPFDGLAPDLAFSPDGRLLAVALLEGDAQIVAVDGGRTVARLETASGNGRSVAFSPDGKQFALGEYGGLVRLYTTRDWKPLGRDLEAHRDRVTALEYSPDGRRLLTGGADGNLRLWDARRRQLIGASLVLAQESYVAAAFAPDGASVFAVPDAGPAARWDVRPASWASHACTVAGRPLTAREWGDTLPGRPLRRVC